MSSISNNTVNKEEISITNVSAEKIGRIGNYIY